MIGNDGGRASDDAICSLVILYKLLGKKEWFLIHHTDCEVETFNSEIMGDLLSGNLKTASDRCVRLASIAMLVVAQQRVKYVKCLSISDQAKSVLADVQPIRNNSMVPSNIPTLWLYL